MNRNVCRQSLCAVITFLLSSPSYADLTVLGGEIYTNTTLLENNDQIVIQAQGEFINDPVGIIDMNGNINNNGVFNQYGLIRTNEFLAGPEGNTLNNTGVFTNSGEFFIETEFHLINSGTFNNYSFLYLTAQPSEIVNTGTFVNNFEVGLWGSLINDTTGTFENNMFSTLNVQGSLENRGVFNNLSMISMQSEFDPSTSSVIPAEFVNSGEFNHSGNISIADGGLNLINTGVFNNNGEFTNSSHSTSLTSINNSGEFNNNSLISTAVESLINSGDFNNSSFLEGVKIVDNSGLLTNSGVIISGDSDAGLFLNTGTVENSGAVDVSGELVNDVLAVFNNNVDMVYGQSAVNVQGALTNRGEFNNHSSIVMSSLMDQATGMEVEPEINNSGLFNNNGVIELMSALGLNINNAGEFNNVGGIQNNAAGSISINNTGLFNNNALLSFGGGHIVTSNSLINNSEINNLALLENTGETLNNGGLITGVLLNTGVFQNNGRLVVNDKFVNGVSGVFNNTIFSLESTRVNGVLENQGIFNNQSTITMNFGYDLSSGALVTAQLNNSGIFNNTGSMTSDYELILNNTGEFNGSGEISSTGSLSINNEGVFNSLGQIKISNEAWVNNVGTFNNGLMFDSILENTSLNVQGSHVNNTGTFNNYRGLNGSEIINSGTLNNKKNISANHRIENNGILNNAGSIVVDVDSRFITPLGNTGLLNSSTGVINNESDPLLYSQPSMLVFGVLDNQGTINNGINSTIEVGYKYGSSSSSSIVSSGTINNDGLIKGNAVNGEDLSNVNIISTGTFINNGSVQASQMEISGVLQGNGDVSLVNGLVITEAGTLAPGNSVGSMDIAGDLFLHGTLEMEFDFTNAGGWNAGLHDIVDISYGDVYLGMNSVLDISLTGWDDFRLGDTYDLLFADSIKGDFGSFYYDALSDNGFAPYALGLQWSVVNGTYQDVLRLEVVSAVPVPAAFWLFLSGLIGLISVQRRKIA